MSQDDEDLDAPRSPRQKRPLSPRIYKSEGAPSGVPRYERGQGAARRYWQILRRGSTITTWFGRVDHAPRTITRPCADVSAAKRTYRTLVALKRTQGYQLTRPAVQHVSTSVSGVCLTNEELELAIDADPSDIQSYLVYADWLQGRGDPRGELIAVHYALLSDAESAILKSVEESILRTYRTDLLGPLSRHAGAFTWYLGFVKSARLHRTAAEPPLAVLVKSLLTHPSGRFVRDLVLGPTHADDERGYAAVFDAIAEVGPRHLGCMRIGEGHPVLGDLTELFTALPRLDKLVLSGSKLRLQDGVRPPVRELVLVNLDLDRETLRALTKTRFSELERLVYRRTGLGGAYIDRMLDRVTSSTMPRLRWLSIAATYLRYGEQAIEPILGLRVLPQLERLDLDLPLAEADVQKLVDASASVAHIERIRLREGNDIGSGLRRDLAQRLPQVEWSSFDSSRGPDSRQWARLDPRRFQE